MNFRESSFSYAALLLITTYVRRMIPNPEMTYGKTWCICLNETGCPDLNWISVKTQAGSVFCVDVCHTPLGSDVKAVFWVERRRLDLLLERAEGKDEEMQIMLGITHGTFDLKRNYHNLSNDTSMRVGEWSVGRWIWIRRLIFSSHRWRWPFLPVAPRRFQPKRREKVFDWVVCSSDCGDGLKFSFGIRTD